MSEDVRKPLGTESGRQALAGVIAVLMETRDFAGAEAALTRRLVAYPGPIATACRGMLGDAVRVQGWERVAAELGRASALGRPVTAVGLDLSNFSDGHGRAWWDKDPVVEVSLYDDSAFGFSTSTRRATQRAAAAHPAPWTGRRLAGPQTVLEVQGLRSVNGAFLGGESARPWGRRAAPGNGDEQVATLLAGWWLVLQFHQAVARQWAEVGPALGVPVLVGQHGVGPWHVTVFDPAEVVATDERPAGLLLAAG